jgi:hypothetical protein
VTLSNSGGAVAIAGNTVTVENGVIVTIAGQTPANVYANVPNYTGSGGNGSTRGTFGGAGATTQPLSQAPIFVAAAANNHANRSATVSSSPGGGRKGSVIHVSDTSELASLLNNAPPGRDGKARVSADSRNRTIPAKSQATAMASHPVRTTDAHTRLGTLALRAQ